MLFKKILIMLAVVMMCAGQSFAEVDAKSVEREMKAIFPNLQVQGVAATSIPGIWEVIAGQNILYFHAESGSTFFGEIYSKRGDNLTANRRNTLFAEKAKVLPLDKAIKIGKGKNIVIEFTDVDCSFCRKAESAFEGRDDVTRYVFLVPLEQLHPKAKAKSLEILCQKENIRGTAYIDTIAGKNDNRDPKSCDGRKAAEDLLAVHISAAQSIGVNGTPMFVVNGQMVAGADIERIKKLLN